MIAEGGVLSALRRGMSCDARFCLALFAIALSDVGDGVREEFDPKLNGEIHERYGPVNHVLVDQRT